MAFRLPNISHVRQNSTLEELEDIPKFASKDCTRKNKIGSGAFSSVYKEIYNGETVVVKVMKDHPTDLKEKKLFCKEVILAYKIPDHVNIAKVMRVCTEEFALMMKYSRFDFSPFGVKQVSHNLSEFLSFLDGEDCTKEFFQYFHKIASDIAEGLRFLHSQNIVHRDLKPSNILVSNEHCHSEEDYKRNLIVCKLTDFGESRSDRIQTRSTLQSKVDDVLKRGTKVYHAPEFYKLHSEISLSQPPKFDKDGLKKADIWALGMVFFSILNPDLRHPYEIETRSLHDDARTKFREEAYQKEQKPEFSSKYEKLRDSTAGISMIKKVYEECTHFQPSNRPTGERICKALTDSSQSFEREENTFPQRNGMSDEPDVPETSEDSDLNLKTPLRDYQRKLSVPALEGKNAILIAPTGSGKTLVAAHIMLQHLKVNKSHKIAFLVHTKALAEQQSQFFSRELPNFKTQLCTGENQDVPLQSLLPRTDVFVLTAQVLINAFSHPDNPVSIFNFSLFIFDECHLCQKEHPFNQIMRKYLSEQAQGKIQIVGFTASIGTGSAASLEAGKSYALQICANLDANVVEAMDVDDGDLSRYVNIPEEIEPHIVEGRSKDAFRDIIEEMMKEIESNPSLQDIVGQKLSQTICKTRDSKMYEAKMIQLQNELPKLIKDPNVLRDVIAGVRQLLDFNKALMVNVDARSSDALKFLKTKMAEKQPHMAKFSDMEWRLFETFTKREADLREAAEDPASCNPLLSKLEELILQEYTKAPTSRCLLFTTTIQSTKALKEWIEDSQLLKHLHLKPGRVTGDRDCTQSQRKITIDDFKQGCHKVLVATNVLEQGTDVEACNLVFRLNYVPNDTGHIQVKGRARAKNGKSFLVATELHGNSLNREMANQVREDMMKKIVADLRNLSEKTLREEIMNIQRRNRVKLAINQRIVEGVGEYKLQCRTCLAEACSSYEIIYYRGGLHVVIEPDFSDKIDVIYFDADRRVTTSPTEEHVGKIYCKKCRENWGSWVIIEEVSYPVLKIEGFLVTDLRTNFQITTKRWKSVPFNDNLERISNLTRYLESLNS